MASVARQGLGLKNPSLNRNRNRKRQDTIIGYHSGLRRLVVRKEKKKKKEKALVTGRGAGKAILEGYTQTTFDAMMSWQTLQRLDDGRGLIGSQGDHEQRNVDFRYLNREHVDVVAGYQSSGCSSTSNTCI